MKILSVLLCALALIASPMALAQASGSNLPPALKAAVNSGNSATIQQTIMTLSGGNATQAAALAYAVAKAAQSLESTNPQGAAAAISAAVAMVNDSKVQNAAPAQVLSVIEVAGQVIGDANVQKVAAVTVGNLATQIAGIASVPAVYATNPTAAIGVMQAAYSAASSPSVAGASPSALNSVRQILTVASSSKLLANENVLNSDQIQAILNSSTSNGAGSNTNNNNLGVQQSGNFTISSVNPGITSPQSISN